MALIWSVAVLSVTSLFTFPALGSVVRCVFPEVGFAENVNESIKAQAAHIMPVPGNRHGSIHRWQIQVGPSKKAQPTHDGPAHNQLQGPHDMYAMHSPSSIGAVEGLPSLPLVCPLLSS